MAFKVGEIVRLKAGAPEMIVEAADEKARRYLHLARRQASSAQPFKSSTLRKG